MKILPGNICVCLVLFLCSFTAYTQTTHYTDSIKKVVATQKSDTNQLSNLMILTYSYRQYDPDSSIAYGQKSLALAEKLDYKPGIFECQVALSQSLMIAGNYPLELEYCFKALSSAKKIGDTSSIAFANYMLSECYYNLGDYHTSLSYLRGVIATVTKSYPYALYQMWVNLSRLFEGMQQPDSALLYARKAYEEMKHNPCLTVGEYLYQAEISRMSPLLGNAFASKAQYDSALYYYRMGIPVSRYYYLETDMIDDYNGIAVVYNVTGKVDSAVWYAQKVLTEKVTKTYPVGFLKAANLLAAIYELKNKPDSTLKYLRIVVSLKDSLFNRDKTIAVQNLTYKEKERERELEDSRIKVQNRFRTYFLLAGLLAILLITGILLRNHRQKQLQNMRNSIADDLHDDIGSTLSSISIMSELAKQQSPEALPLLASIGENTITIQENMSDIVWAIKAENDRFENVLQRMNQFAFEILDAKNIELDFTNDASLSTLRLTMGQRKNFYLFFKEVINNAAKYSDAKKVSVCIAQKDHHIEMNIADNGKGFDSARIFNGNGMSTLRKRGTELNADFKISSHINQGTAIQLKFKIT